MSAATTDFTDMGQRSGGNQSGPALVGELNFDGSGHQTCDAQGSNVRPVEPSHADLTLRLLADVLDDLESVRIANQNRLRTLTTSPKVHGLGLDPEAPEALRLAGLVDGLTQLEKQAEKDLARGLKAHPLGSAAKAMPGVGDKQGARLLAAIGNPYIHGATGLPRAVGSLWSYAGHGDASRKRHKGMSQAELFALGSPEAKMRTYLVATSVWKSGVRDGQPTNDLVAVGYGRKSSTEGRTHAVECRRCGPSGKPAEAGSPWSDAHRHADALRVLGKEVLRRLWLAARDQDA